MSDYFSGTSEFNEKTLLSIIRNFTSESISILDFVSQGRRVLHTGRSSGIARKAFVDAQNRKYVLKEFPRYAVNVKFAYQVLLFQNKLRQDFRLPIPRYLPLLADPSTYFHVTSAEGQINIFTLQEMAGGQSPERISKAIISSAKLMSRFHCASEIITTSLKLSSLPQDNIFDSTHKLLKRGYEEMLNTPKPVFNNNELASLQRLIEKYQTCIEFYRKQAQISGYFDFSLAVHGDCHFNNMLFDSSGKVSALLDFDDCKHDHPVQDIARLAISVGIFNFPEQPDNPFTQVPRRVNISNMFNVLKSYIAESSRDYGVVRNFTPAVKCLAIQLAFIGFLSGGYKFDQLDDLRDFPNTLEDFICDEWFNEAISHTST